MIKHILLIAIVAFFAINMGASGIAPSFAATWGSGLIKKKRATILFAAFVILGAILLGRNVALTLGKGLLPKEFIGFETTFIILASASASLFLANMLKIPQSTSQVTVGAVVGAGLYFKHIYVRTLFLKVLPMWLILPLASYILTFLIYRTIYPPKDGNLHVYQRLFANNRQIGLSAIVTSCYVAFAIGSNNVANAVGPLFGAGLIDIYAGLLLIAPIFGVGAWVMGQGPIETAGKEVVPLGLASSALVSFVTATLLIFASILGIPQSLVQLNLASIFAISCLKNGHRHTWDHHVIRRTFLIWFITPLASMAMTYILLLLFRH